MYCTSCSSRNQAVFAAEMNIHFSGLNNIDKAGILVFPKLLVCLDCGSSRFTISETELSRLVQCAPTQGVSNRQGSIDVVLHRRITFRA